MTHDAEPRAGGRRPRLAVTLGDPRGIGPEIVAQALQQPEVRSWAELRIVGPHGLSGVADLTAEFHGVGTWGPGAGPAAAGRLAGEAVRVAIEMALSGRVDGIVTAPIDKAAFHAGGWDHAGHTEMLQAHCGVPAVAMMMDAETTVAGGGLRVVLATTHLALRDVPNALTVERFVQQGRLTHESLRSWWGIARPRLVLCAVNPHAGDAGRFGDEESRILVPAIERLRAEGIVVDGPLPADTVFLRTLRGEWDAVIAPYHDVGMAAFKTAAFGRGVNVTLGLPFPRTSPDHGTALDIAGRGIADPASLIHAIRLAARLARGFDTPPTRD
jgi:4-hydroxythreonine-4-phosphate dehydrogenase